MIKYAFQLFHNSLVTNLFISLVITIVMLLFNFISGFIYAESISMDELNKQFGENYIYFQPRSIDSNNESIASKIEEQKTILDDIILKNKNRIEGYDFINNYLVYTKNKLKIQEIGVLSYTKSILQNSNYTIIEGSMINFNNDNIIEILATKNFGDVGEEIILTNETHTQSVKVRIVGIIKTRFDTLRFTSAGTSITASSFYKEVDSSYEGIPYIICEQNFLIENLANRIFQDSNVLIKYDDRLTDEQLVELFDLLEVDGWVSGKSDIVLNTNKRIDELGIYYVPLIIFALLISTIGLISVIAINNYINKHIISIFLLCGCSKIKLILINYLYNMIIVVNSLMILVIISLFRNTDIKILAINTYTYQSLPIMLSVLVFYQVVAIVTSYIVLRKQSVKQLLINEFEKLSHTTQ